MSATDRQFVFFHFHTALSNHLHWCRQTSKQNFANHRNKNPPIVGIKIRQSSEWKFAIGFLFETLCVRDLRIFADYLGGEVCHPKGLIPKRSSKWTHTANCLPISHSFKGLASEKTTLLRLINGLIPLFYQGNVKGNILKLNCRSCMLHKIDSYVSLRYR